MRLLGRTLLRSKHTPFSKGEGGAWVKKRIYVIRSREFVKIGITTDINVRLSELQVGNPIRLSVEALSEPTDDHAALEDLLHRAHGGTRVGGEWFEMSPYEADGLKLLLTEHQEELERILVWSDDEVADYLTLREQSLVVPPANQEA